MVALPASGRQQDILPGSTAVLVAFQIVSVDTCSWLLDRRTSVFALFVDVFGHFLGLFSGIRSVTAAKLRNLLPVIFGGRASFCVSFGQFVGAPSVTTSEIRNLVSVTFGGRIGLCSSFGHVVRGPSGATAEIRDLVSVTFARRVLLPTDTFGRGNYVLTTGRILWS